jgi:hypothetical protein
MVNLQRESISHNVASDYIARGAQLASLLSVETLVISSERASIRTLTDDPGRELLGAQNFSRDDQPAFWHSQRTVTAEELNAPHPHLTSGMLDEFSVFVSRLAMPLHQVFARSQYEPRSQAEIPVLGVIAACDVRDARQIFQYASTVERLIRRALSSTLEGMYPLEKGAVIKIQPAPYVDGRIY